MIFIPTRGKRMVVEMVSVHIHIYPSPRSQGLRQRSALYSLLTVTSAPMGKVGIWGLSLRFTLSWYPYRSPLGESIRT